MQEITKPQLISLLEKLTAPNREQGAFMEILAELNDIYYPRYEFSMVAQEEDEPSSDYLVIKKPRLNQPAEMHMSDFEWALIWGLISFISETWAQDTIPAFDILRSQNELTDTQEIIYIELPISYGS